MPESNSNVTQLIDFSHCRVSVTDGRWSCETTLKYKNSVEIQVPFLNMIKTEKECIVLATACVYRVCGYGFAIEIVAHSPSSL